LLQDRALACACWGNFARLNFRRDSSNFLGARTHAHTAAGMIIICSYQYYLYQ
jgi:hypothetical protein